MRKKLTQNQKIFNKINRAGIKRGYWQKEDNINSLSSMSKIFGQNDFAKFHFFIDLEEKFKISFLAEEVTESTNIEEMVRLIKTKKENENELEQQSAFFSMRQTKKNSFYNKMSTYEKGLFWDIQKTVKESLSKPDLERSNEVDYFV